MDVSGHDGRIVGSPSISQDAAVGAGAIFNASQGNLGQMAQILGVSPLDLLAQLDRGTLDLSRITPAGAEQLKEVAAQFAAKVEANPVAAPYAVFQDPNRAGMVMVIPRDKLGELAKVAVETATEAAAKSKVKTAADFEFKQGTTLADLMSKGPKSHGGTLEDEQWQALQILKERFDISFDGGVLAVNPKLLEAAASFGVLSVEVEANEQGGQNLKPPAGASFGRAEIVSVKPSEFSLNPNQDPALAAQHLDMHSEQSAMLIELKNGAESEKFLLLFAREGGFFGGGNDAIATVCQQVTIYPFEGGAPQVVAFKPVVYLYPTERRSTRVSIDIGAGTFVAQYPRMTDGAWEVIANPNGSLLDPKTDRQYPYLFWEARLSRPFFLERKKCFCVARTDAARFLEEVSDRFALNAQERTDFITYWLPSIEANPYTVIQFMDEQYESQARLDVSPKPDTIIRLYIVIAGSAEKVDTGLALASDLPQRDRAGFTVVEWGGSNLDLHRP